MTRRNLGIELLRIISMMMIIVLHIFGQGGVLRDEVDGVNAIVWLMEILAYCSVDCYALISGYVGSNSEYNAKKALKLWLQVLYYSIIISVIVGILKPELVNREYVIKALFPVFTEQHWYVTAYFEMMLFLPIINNGIKNCSKKTLRIFILLSIICVMTIPNLFKLSIFGFTDCGAMLWLSIMYVVGFYAKQYPEDFEKLSVSKCIAGYILMSLITWGTRMIACKRFIDYTAPTVFMAAVFLLIGFSKVCIKDKLYKFITFFSVSSLSVMLIHSNPLVYENYTKNSMEFLLNYNALVIVALVVIIAVSVYVVCSLIDKVRLFIFRLIKL